MLSVALNEVPEFGHENEKVRVKVINPDLQGSASPGSINISISGKKLVVFPLG